MDNKPQEYTVEWSIGGIYAENPAGAVAQALGINAGPSQHRHPFSGNWGGRE